MEKDLVKELEKKNSEYFDQNSDLKWEDFEDYIRIDPRVNHSVNFNFTILEKHLSNSNTIELVVVSNVIFGLDENIERIEVPTAENFTNRLFVQDHLNISLSLLSTKELVPQTTTSTEQKSVLFSFWDFFVFAIIISFLSSVGIFGHKDSKKRGISFTE